MSTSSSKSSPEQAETSASQTPEATLQSAAAATSTRRPAEPPVHVDHQVKLMRAEDDEEETTSLTRRARRAAERKAEPAEDSLTEDAAKEARARFLAEAQRGEQAVQRSQQAFLDRLENERRRLLERHQESKQKFAAQKASREQLENAELRASQAAIERHNQLADEVRSRAAAEARAQIEHEFEARLAAAAAAQAQADAEASAAAIARAEAEKAAAMARAEAERQAEARAEAEEQMALAGERARAEAEKARVAAEARVLEENKEKLAQAQETLRAAMEAEAAAAREQARVEIEAIRTKAAADAQALQRKTEAELDAVRQEAAAEAAAAREQAAADSEAARQAAAEQAEKVRAQAAAQTQRIRKQAEAQAQAAQAAAAAEAEKAREEAEAAMSEARANADQARREAELVAQTAEQQSAEARAQLKQARQEAAAEALAAKEQAAADAQATRDRAARELAEAKKQAEAQAEEARRVAAAEASDAKAKAEEAKQQAARELAEAKKQAEAQAEEARQQAARELAEAKKQAEAQAEEARRVAAAEASDAKAKAEEVRRQAARELAEAKRQALIETQNAKLAAAAEAAEAKAESRAAAAAARLEADKARQLAEAEAEKARQAAADEIARVRAAAEAAAQAAQEEADKARQLAEAEAEKARQVAAEETAQVRAAAEAAAQAAQEEADKARQLAEAEAEKARQSIEEAYREANLRADEAEAQARVEGERAREEAKKEAELAREEARLVASTAQAEAEAARADAAQAQAKLDLVAAELAEKKIEADQVRQEAEAAMESARREAQRAKEDAEAAQAALVVETQAVHAAAEKRVRVQAEAARAKALEVAEQARREAESAQAKFEAEAQAVSEAAQAQAKAEADLAKEAAQQEVAAARSQAEAATHAAQQAQEEFERQTQMAIATAEQLERESRAAMAQAEVERQARQRAEEEASAAVAAADAAAESRKATEKRIAEARAARSQGTTDQPHVAAQAVPLEAADSERPLGDRRDETLPRAPRSLTAQERTSAAEGFTAASLPITGAPPSSLAGGASYAEPALPGDATGVSGSGQGDNLDTPATARNPQDVSAAAGRPVPSAFSAVEQTSLAAEAENSDEQSVPAPANPAADNSRTAATGKSVFRQIFDEDAPVPPAAPGMNVAFDDEDTDPGATVYVTQDDARPATTDSEAQVPLLESKDDVAPAVAASVAPDGSQAMSGSVDASQAESSVGALPSATVEAAYGPVGTAVDDKSVADRGNVPQNQAPQPSQIETDQTSGVTLRDVLAAGSAGPVGPVVTGGLHLAVADTEAADADWAATAPVPPADEQLEDDETEFVDPEESQHPVDFVTDADGSDAVDDGQDPVDASKAGRLVSPDQGPEADGRQPEPCESSTAPEAAVLAAPAHVTTRRSNQQHLGTGLEDVAELDAEDSEETEQPSALGGEDSVTQSSPGSRQSAQDSSSDDDDPDGPKRPAPGRRRDPVQPERRIPGSSDVDSPSSPQVSFATDAAEATGSTVDLAFTQDRDCTTAPVEDVAKPTPVAPAALQAAIGAEIAPPAPVTPPQPDPAVLAQAREEGAQSDRPPSPSPTAHPTIRPVSGEHPQATPTDAAKVATQVRESVQPTPAGLNGPGQAIRASLAAPHAGAQPEVHNTGSSIRSDVPVSQSAWGALVNQFKPRAGQAWVWALAVFFVVLALVVALIFGPRFMKKAEPGAGAAVEATPVRTLLVTLTEGGDSKAVQQVALLGASAEQANMVLVPASTMMSVPGQGRIPLSKSAAHSAKAPGQAVATALDVRIDQSWVISKNGLVAFINGLGGLSMSVEQAVSTDGVNVSAGPDQQLSGAEAVAYANFLDDGEPETSRSARWASVMAAIVRQLSPNPNKVSGDLAAVADTSTIIGERGDVAKTLVEAHLRAAQGQYASVVLPTKEIAVGSEEELLTVNDREALQLAKDRFGAAYVGGAVDRVRVLVQDGVGSPALHSKAQTKLEEAKGLTFVDGGQPTTLGVQKSIVAVSADTKENRKRAFRVAEALGLSRDAVGTVEQYPTDVDVMVVLGSDFAGSGKAVEPASTAGAETSSAASKVRDEGSVGQPADSESVRPTPTASSSTPVAKKSPTSSSPTPAKGSPSESKPQDGGGPTFTLAPGKPTPKLPGNPPG